MVTQIADAFALLTLPDTLLKCSSGTERGPLILECVTYTNHHNVPGDDEPVILVLRVNALEAVIDPRRQVTLSAEPGASRIYTFHGVTEDPSEITLTLPWLGSGYDDPKASAGAADIDTLDQILSQYAQFTSGGHIDTQTLQVQNAEEDLRGRLILVDETNGEILGPVGGKDSISQDPTLQKAGHEQDAVVIDLGAEEELEARKLFARAIPPGEHDMITRTASALSNGISGATKILVNGMNSASNLYVSRATPHPSASPSIDGRPTPPPPRAVQWLTSDGTKRSLSTASTYTGKAVQVSSRTLSAVEGVISRIVAPKNKGKGRADGPIHRPRSAENMMFDPNLPTEKSSPLSPNPPPYSSGTPPALPPRKTPSAPASRSMTPAPAHPNETPAEKLNRTAKLVLSAQLVLSTVQHSSKKLVATGSENIATMVGHKYGAEAGASTRSLTGTARNVALVYIDVTGLGHKALLKTAGKHYIKARIGGKKYQLKTDEKGQVVEAEPVREKI